MSYRCQLSYNIPINPTFDITSPTPKKRQLTASDRRYSIYNNRPTYNKSTRRWKETAREQHLPVFASLKRIHTSADIHHLLFRVYHHTGPFPAPNVQQQDGGSCKRNELRSSQNKWSAGKDYDAPANVVQGRDPSSTVHPEYDYKISPRWCRWLAMGNSSRTACLGSG